ncbi:MAG: DUF4351 domain-containing protein [Nostoc sp.]|uniref:DUF4351 domain-containing protein n=1 Tax=Nostoc sp. TaxID=1180 RepID=UPI002FF760CB
MQTRGYIKSGGRNVRSLVLRLLKRLFGEIAEELLAKIQVLSLEQLEALGEALLELRLRALTQVLTFVYTNVTIIYDRGCIRL